MGSLKSFLLILVLFAFAIASQSNLGLPTLKQVPNGLGKQAAISYCSYAGMYIYAQDANVQYLGFITDNQYSTESIINDYGTYGSKYSSKSIRNEYSTYGSPYSSYSAYNEYTSTPPIIYSYSSVTGKYTAVAYLTKNIYKTPAIDPDLLIANLIVGCSTPPPTYITDLLVDSLTCTTVGDSIRVRFTVLNAGNLSISKAFKIGLYNNGVLLTFWNSTSALLADYYYTLTYSFKPTVPTNVIKAFADYDSLIVENYEYNNSLSKTVYASTSIDTTDLKIDSLHLRLSKDTLWFTFNMLNNGNTTIPKGIKNAIYINGVLDLTTDSTADLLPPKYFYPYSFFITSFSSATMRIRVCIDATGKVVEKYENNNCDSGSINVPLVNVTNPFQSKLNPITPPFLFNGKSVYVGQLANPATLGICDMTGKLIVSYEIEKNSPFILSLNQVIKSNGTYICFLKRNGSLIISKTISLMK